MCVHEGDISLTSSMDLPKEHNGPLSCTTGTLPLCPAFSPPPPHPWLNSSFSPVIKYFCVHLRWDVPGWISGNGKGGRDWQDSREHCSFSIMHTIPLQLPFDVIKSTLFAKSNSPQQLLTPRVLVSWKLFLQAPTLLPCGLLLPAPILTPLLRGLQFYS